MAEKNEKNSENIEHSKAQEKGAFEWALMGFRLPGLLLTWQVAMKTHQSRITICLNLEHMYNMIYTYTEY